MDLKNACREETYKCIFELRARGRKAMLNKRATSVERGPSSTKPRLDINILTGKRKQTKERVSDQRWRAHGKFVSRKNNGRERAIDIEKGTRRGENERTVKEKSSVRCSKRIIKKKVYGSAFGREKQDEDVATLCPVGNKQRQARKTFFFIIHLFDSHTSTR